VYSSLLSRRLSFNSPRSDQRLFFECPPFSLPHVFLIFSTDLIHFRRGGVFLVLRTFLHGFFRLRWRPFALLCYTPVDLTYAGDLLSKKDIERITHLHLLRLVAFSPSQWHSFFRLLVRGTFHLGPTHRGAFDEKDRRLFLPRFVSFATAWKSALTLLQSLLPQILLACFFSHFFPSRTVPLMGLRPLSSPTTLTPRNSSPSDPPRAFFFQNILQRLF